MQEVVSVQEKAQNYLNRCAVWGLEPLGHDVFVQSMEVLRESGVLKYFVSRKALWRIEDCFVTPMLTRYRQFTLEGMYAVVSGPGYMWNGFIERSALAIGADIGGGIIRILSAKRPVNIVPGSHWGENDKKRLCESLALAFKSPGACIFHESVFHPVYYFNEW
jgi:hypothetical protein